MVRSLLDRDFTGIVTWCPLADRSKCMFPETSVWLLWESHVFNFPNSQFLRFVNGRQPVSLTFLHNKSAPTHQIYTIKVSNPKLTSISFTNLKKGRFRSLERLDTWLLHSSHPNMTHDFDDTWLWNTLSHNRWIWSSHKYLLFIVLCQGILCAFLWWGILR